MTKKRLSVLLAVWTAAAVFALSYLPPWRRPISEEPDVDIGSSLFSEGLLAVSKDGKWGYVDRRGREVIPLQYDSAAPFEENGIAEVICEGERGYRYINTRGEFVEKPEYKGGQTQRNNKRDIAPWYWDKELDPPLYGLTDGGGNILVEPSFSDVNRFSSVWDLAPACLYGISAERAWGVVDTEGTFTISPRYSKVCNTFGSDGLLLVQKKGRWCFVNPYGWTIYKLPEEIILIDYWGCDGGTTGVAFGSSGWWCIFDRRGRIITERGEYDDFRI